MNPKHSIGTITYFIGVAQGDCTGMKIRRIRRTISTGIEGVFNRGLEQKWVKEMWRGAEFTQKCFERKWVKEK